MVIANRESGSFTTGVDTVKNLLDQYEIAHQLISVETLQEAKKAAQKADPKKHFAVAVFGGDGTIITVARQFIDQSLPVMLLPGGSANSLAREVDSPFSLDNILKFYAQGAYTIRRLQLGDRDGEEMFLDAHYGLFAESLEQTPRPLKNIFGQFAYALTMLQKVLNTELRHYRIEADGQTIEADGHVLFIVNHGRPRILGQPLLPSYQEGMLRLALVRSANLHQVVGWYVMKKLFRRNRSSVVIARRAERIVVHQAPPQYSFDDMPSDAPKLPNVYTVSSRNIRILVPAPARHSWWSRLKVVQTTYYRLLDHTRRFLGGQPSLRYSRISKHLYLGGQYRATAIPLFRRWNVTGVVSMREFIPKKIAGIEILHLPTVDHTPPTLENLQKGVEFIQGRIDKGEAVYIHCRLGEGRGPSMAAAYLISTGMRPQDAILHLQRTRPFARPNKKQTEQLMRFADKYTIQ